MRLATGLSLGGEIFDIPAFDKAENIEEFEAVKEE